MSELNCIIKNIYTNNTVSTFESIQLAILLGAFLLFVLFLLSMSERNKKYRKEETFKKRR